MRPKDFAGLILLGALWGGSFLFIRVAVPALGPFLLVELRVGLAAAALFFYALAAGRMPKIRGRWRSFLVLGLMNAAVPFSLISAAEIHLTASLAAILNSTTVMFTAIVAAVWMGDALTARKAIGIVLGIVGVRVLLGGAVALLLPLAVVSLPERAPSTVVTFSMLGLAFLSTAVAYLIYFRLIENVGPTSTVTVTLLVPVFGLLFGVLLLEEPFGPGTLAGLGIILTSVVLITGIAPRKSKLEQDCSG